MQRCLIVDDNQRFLMAARRLLESEGFDVVGTASTMEAAIQRVDELRPDLTLVDVELGSQSGLDLARRLDQGQHRYRPDVILMSAGRPADYAQLVEDLPVLGFVAKDALSAAAIAAITRGRPRSPG